MKTVNARLDIEVFVNCPRCDSLIDLLDNGETSKKNHNEEGAVIMQAFPSGRWLEAHENFMVNNVTCSHCDKSFDVKTLEW